MIRPIAVLALTALPALADESPAAAVKMVLDYHQSACAAQGGTLTIAEDAVVEAELSGDGQPDLLLDGSKLSCSTAPAMFCGEGAGCELTAFVGTVRHPTIVLDWRLEQAGDRQDLIITTAGFLLNKPDDMTSRLRWDTAIAGFAFVEYLN
ncbi:MAG: hypothetical protein J0L76_06775 [Rhodobacterales bacterium]|nr:hypothetical protein [Rhodobacterales bacterium]